MTQAHAGRSPTEQLAAAASLPGRARLIVVFVLDGLRPELINPIDTPHLFRLRQEGVNYLNGHAVFPTLTRVNATAIATGAYPGTNGIIGNAMYVPAVDSSQTFETGDFQKLLTLDERSGGRMVSVQTLGERLEAHGLRYAVVSSGSTGTSLLLNPRAVGGVGILVNGYFDPGRLVAFPPEVNAAILARFGAAPPKGHSQDPSDGAVDWTEEVLREFVLPELHPDVVLNWLTEPDHTQHAFGVGSPQSQAMLRNDDRHIGLTLETLQRLGLAEHTDIFVVSDHGFSVNTFAVNIRQELTGAGLKAGLDSDDVVVVGGFDQSILLHVQDHQPSRIQQIVEFLQAQAWTGVIFTAPKGAKDIQGGSVAGPPPGNGLALDPAGWVPGTFSLQLIHMDHAERGPDIVFTFPWTSAKNAFGLEGTDSINTARTTGPLTGNVSAHGSMSPWTIRNTFFAWGVDFKRGITVRIPASNVDLTPTILALKGIPEREACDGRALLEALHGGPDEEQVLAETRVLTTQTDGGSYMAAIQVSQVGHQRYIDKSWRIR